MIVETTCRYPDCRAPILMVGTAKSQGIRKMPLWREPSERGNVLIDRDLGLCHTLAGADLDRARHEGAELHLTHFDGCPGAADARRSRR